MKHEALGGLNPRLMSFDWESAEPTSQTGDCRNEASTSALVSRTATAPSTS